MADEKLIHSVDASSAQNNQPYVFISYAHADKNIVLPILAELKSKGVNIWFDEGIEAGAEWPEYIANQVKDCAKFLLFLSPAYALSQNCKRELNFAISCKKNILSVYLEDVELSPGMEMQLGTYQAIFRSRFADNATFYQSLCSSQFFSICLDGACDGEPDEEAVSVTDEKVLPETEQTTETDATASIVYDDAAEEAKYLAARKAQIEEDRQKPFDPDAILEVRHLRKCFPLKKTVTGKVTQELIAVDDVSFKLMPGETLGIVGESGCGKTTMGRAILKLHQPSGGQIIFDGKDITNYKSAQMREIRKQMQIIFQDPYSSLPPRSTVGGILSEPVEVHNIVPKAEVKDYVLELMDKCGLRDYYYERYPHEFSGGQRQRICIARALSVNPKLVVCDEPVSALDVSIQAQIINLLKKLQQDMNLTYIFISHDLSVVKFISDKIGVMYLGAMMEYGNKKDIFANPLHPYTKALFSAIPHPDPDVKMQRIPLTGDIPSPANPPKGCRFHTRCPYAKEICKHITPAYKEYEEGHFAACHLLDEE